MREESIAVIASAMSILLVSFVIAQEASQPQIEETKTSTNESPVATAKIESKIKPPAKIAPFINNGIDWLIKAQHKDGGWGGGSHSAQGERDPHKVPSDPATTSFTTMALIRSGSTPAEGPHRKAVRKALEYLVSTVEQADDDGPRITDLQGTQPQTKLGGLVDTTMTTQCLARVLKEMSNEDELYSRVDKALDKCIAKLEKSQKNDGSWNVAGGWAPVLQSSSGQTALELAKVAGKSVSPDAIVRARDYQSENVDASGRAAPGPTAGAAAGVELYSFSSSQRGNAVNARFAYQLIKDAKAGGRLSKSAEVSEESLKKTGLDEDEAEVLGQAFEQNKNQIKRLGDDNLLRGFGNNGGEEFISFLLMSESMIIAGEDEWHKWNDKMHGLLQKIQNQDGSWSGHHCITNSTFCTAAVVQCLLADRDADILIEIAEQTTKKTKTGSSTATPNSDPDKD